LGARACVGSYDPQTYEACQVKVLQKSFLVWSSRWTQSINVSIITNVAPDLALIVACTCLHENTGNYEKDRGKEFEGSYTRVLFIMVITYLTLFGYMTLIGTRNAALNAIVPTLGFNISTWSLPYIKDVWITFKNNTGQTLASTRQSKGDLQDEMMDAGGVAEAV
jgi:hypothetical protein